VGEKWQPEQAVLTDGQNVSETFCDGVVGTGTMHGNLYLTLSTSRLVAGSPPRIERVITARIVMPLSTATEVHTMLGDTLKKANQRVAFAAAKPGPRVQ
jgi:hypothetical protein